jgi:hypothetical protein
MNVLFVMPMNQSVPRSNTVSDDPHNFFDHSHYLISLSQGQRTGLHVHYTCSCVVNSLQLHV